MKQIHNSEYIHSEGHVKQNIIYFFLAIFYRDREFTALIRSKNAGLRTLTLDVLFQTKWLPGPIRAQANAALISGFGREYRARRQFHTIVRV